MQVNRFSESVRLLTTLVPLCLAAQTACSAGDSPGDPVVTERRQSLSVTTARPVPFCPAQGKPCFGGGAVELVVADALAECGVQSTADVSYGTTDLLDAYLVTIRQHMAAARCHPQDQTNLSKWIANRANVDCNVDAGNVTEFRSYPLQPLSPALNVTYGTSARPCGAGNASDTLPDFALRNIHNTALNACLAQRLRAVMPGTAGAEGLVLDRSQQRELLEVIRERAQLALIGYSRLMLAGEVAFPPGCSDVGGSLPDQLVSLSQWIAGQPADRIDGMGHDLATLSEIHIQTTRDLLSLLTRSASAREAASSDTQSINDRDWSKGGWRQRAAALLYGGDPLSTGANSAAGWTQVLPTVENWPSYNHVTQGLSGPETYVFSRLARECDSQYLVNAPTSPFAYQSALTADIGYKNVEACLRTKACTTKVLGDCVPVTITDLPADLAQNFSSTLLWKQHRIRPEHAAEAMKIMSERVSATDPAGPAPFLVRGAAAVAPLNGYLVTYLDKNASFEPTPATLRAGAFSSLVGTYPTVNSEQEFRTLFLRTETAPQNRASRQGFPIDRVAAQRDAERIRLSGSLSALANVRDAYFEGCGSFGTSAV